MTGVEQDDDYGDGLQGPCAHCEDGLVMVCPDDLCRATGECHSVPRDPSCFKTCPYCKGEGK